MSYTVVVCEHGYLKRKCPHCENAELTQRVAALEAALRFWMPAKAPMDNGIAQVWREHRALLHDSQEEKAGRLRIGPNGDVV